MASDRMERLAQFFKQSTWVPGLFLVAVTVLAYQPVWHAGFIWDDDVYVTTNRLLMEPDGLRRIWFSLDSPSQYFPLTYTWFRFEHALWGLNPAGYHWVNLLLHSLNAMLVWRLLRRLAVPGAWLAAAIFALHPVQVETVAWVTELKNVLMLFFYLLAVFAWIAFLEKSTAERWRYYLLALGLHALALCAKTTACTLPVTLLLILWLQGKPIGWRRLAQTVPFFAFSLGMGLLTIWWERYHQGTEGQTFAIAWPQRVLVAAHAIWFYLGKLVWPSRLTFIYPQWRVGSISPLWLAALAGLGVAVYSSRRFFGRSVETALVFFVVTLSPVLGFIMLYTFRYTFVADHYQYVACIGPIALAAAGIFRVCGFLGRWQQAAKALVSGVLILVLGCLTWRQSQMYAGAESLWRATIERNPGCWMAYDNLSYDALSRGENAEAARNSQKALALNPADAEAYRNFGISLLNRGQTAQAVVQLRKAAEIDPSDAANFNNLGGALLKEGRLDEAMADFQRARQLSPNLPDSYTGLGAVCLQKGQTQMAIHYDEQAVALAPDDPTAHCNLAIALEHAQRLDQAIQQYEMTVELDPSRADVHDHLGTLLEQEKRFDQALREFQEAVRFDPMNMSAQNHLVTALNRAGRAADAIHQLQEMVMLHPDSADLHYNLGNALVKQGRLPEAIGQFEETIKLNPGDVAAHNNLGIAFFRSGRLGEAIGQFQEALNLKPDDAGAKNNLAAALKAKSASPGAPENISTDRQPVR